MPESPSLDQSLAYRWRLLITFLSLVAGLIGSAFSQPLFPENSNADRWFDTAGWLILAAGIALRSWAAREISGRKRLTIVDRGPYALCRNPLYVGTFLIAASQWFFLRSLVYLVSLAIPAAWYVFGVVPAEERYLTETRGEEYLSYYQRTTRWWPRWSRNVWHRAEVMNSSSYARESLHLVCWALLPFVSESVCYLRELPGWCCLVLPF